jgi:acid phosphatase
MAIAWAAVLLGVLAGLTACGRQPHAELRFAAMGSTGTGGEGQRGVAEALARRHAETSLDFVLLMGDNFRPDGVAGTGDMLWRTQFSDVYPAKRLPMPFRALPGDRDHDGDIDAQLAYEGDKRWDMPGRYYRMKYELTGGRTTEIFAIDTTRLRDKANPDTRQLAWLSSSLATSGADWRIVAGHHGILRVDGRRDRPLAATLLPLLHEHDVDVYLSGREHVLALATDEAGLVHVTGGAGAMISDPVPGPGIACLAPRQGFVRIGVTGDRLALTLEDRDQRIHCRHELVAGGKDD